MKVTFVYADIVRDSSWPGSYSTGLASLSAVLKRAGHDVSLIHVTTPPEHDALLSRLRRERPGLLGFSSTSIVFPFVREWCRSLKGRLDIPTICGGVHATLAPEETLSCEGIDMVCEGEGEATLTEVCERLDQKEPLDGIPGLWVKRDGEIRKGEHRPILGNLDALPHPDRSIFDYKRLNLVNQGKGIVMASRGCPFQCTYCSNHALRKQAGRGVPYVRFRGVDNVIDEIQKLLADYPFLSSIHFEDDIFPLKKEWFREFLKRYREKIGLPFTSNIHPGLMNEEVARVLREGGCAMLQMGLESGNDYIRREILKRPISREQLVNAFLLCRKYGIKTLAFNMVGIPFETPARILDTIKLNAEVRPDLSQTSITYPFPLTKMHEMCKANGLLAERRVCDYFSHSDLDLPGLSDDRVSFFRVYFKVLVRMYAFLMRMPGPLRRTGIGALDRILCTQWNLDPAYRAMNWAYRALEHVAKQLRAKLRLRRIRLKVQALGSREGMPLDGSSAPATSRAAKDRSD